MRVNYGRQTINADDIEAVLNVLKTPLLTQGPLLRTFENALSAETSFRYSIAANSATSCLYLSLKALSIKTGDLVWTSPITFAATANMAIMCGASIDFVDIQLDTYNMCPKNLKSKLETASQKDKLPNAIIFVSMCGNWSNLKEVSELCNEYDVKLIHDASHSLGAEPDTQSIDRQICDATVYSFHPVKMITTGEGGAVLTDKEYIYKSCELLRSHGITRKRDDLDKIDAEDWFYEQVDIGFNFRLTDIQAALGLSQLKKLRAFVQKRNEIARLYQDQLNADSYAYQKINKSCKSSYHLFSVLCKNKKYRDEAYKQLKSRGIGTNVHYIPIYRHPYYKQWQFEYGNFPASEEYYERCLSLPIFPGLDPNIISEVSMILNGI